MVTLDWGIPPNGSWLAETLNGTVCNAIETANTNAKKLTATFDR